MIILWGLILATESLCSAATGTIAGRVADEISGEPLIGANVTIEHSSFGSATDLDGQFIVSNLNEGTYNLLISYMGYEKKRVTGIELYHGETKRLGITMKTSVVGMDEIVVEVESEHTSDAFLLSEQKNSLNVQDGVSSEQISKSGDSNAADAFKRVTGVSVLDGKYVYVRGLGHRYTTAQMNNVPIPSPEPERRTVPLNLFPAEVLESISAYKTYTPDLPGAFAGGSVNIRTKAYPDNRMFKMSAGLSDRSYLYDSFVYRVSGHSGSDYFGFDNASRSLPKAVPSDYKVELSNPLQGQLTNTEWSQKLGTIARSFQTDFIGESFSPAKPVSLAMSLGNRFNPSGKLEYGYYLNASFGNDYFYRLEDTRQYSISGDTLYSGVNLIHHRTSYNTNGSLSFSTGFKYNQNHKIKFYNIYTHSSEDQVNYSSGETENVDDGVYIQTDYVEKSILNSTLTGSHLFKNKFEQRLEWALNTGISDLYEPDMQSHIYLWKETRNRYELDVKSSEPKRKYTSGKDLNGNADVNYSIEYKDLTGESYTLKIGIRNQRKERSFSKRNLMYVFSPGMTTDRMRDLIYVYPDSDDVFGQAFTYDNMFYMDDNGVSHPGMVLIDDPGDGGNKSAYDANENLDAFYAMAELPLSFGHFPVLKSVHFVGGYRLEAYKMNLYPYDSVTKSPFVNNYGDTIISRIDESDILPSYNLIIDFPRDMKIRASYSETVARAEFREVAPFEYQEFYGGQYSVGYPYLKTTDIRNLDLRWEWYRKTGEMIAIGIYHKDFKNPIEVALIQPGERIYRSYTNAPSARNYGIEFDIRLNLTMIPIKYGYGTFSMNTSYSQSNVDMQSEFVIFTGDTIANSASSLHRSMQGHSDFILNAGLNLNSVTGWEVNLAYNTFSRRLASLGVGRLNDEYEYPFNSLNLTLAKKIRQLKINFKANNLLNSNVRFGVIEESTGKIKYTRSYTPGMNFSLGVSANL